ncbi:hypothetical protein MYCTH_80223 [Thermothelomyces thermophilus ATCC 42464]|uniref:CENP-V/GFA domain-containing protein n=1 Tax=Thermothelomyces thermophilus (strain ATCC 42464 / BCRC 31852 / DSM 1799) TaxID=573729 RepID=G2QD36_THET4|nr:uncharacterized protein MYCTH_80223 [Thermothelomyces thermophilus ATCC 42464]AEO58254.1 hypothetical protein MYCTH_80223 [Thermothelomyces thermophilus ATCC 42464]
MAAYLHLPHQLAGANKTLTAKCHCKSVQYTITVPTSALPLPVHLCHCSVCRYTHGTLSSVHAPLPKGIEPSFVPPSVLESSVTGYVHSAQATSERYFCSTCGCHIGDRSLKPDPDTGRPHWCVATSVFTVHDEDTFQIRSHIFSAPETEPNLATWLPVINSRPIHHWNPPPRPQQQQQQQNADRDRDRDDKPPSACHCGGVCFAIVAPSETEAADPLAARFLRRAGSSLTLKRVACLCLCRDCRLVSGAHAVAWTFVPRSRIRPPTLLPPSATTLRTYRSSDKVTRAFCGVCGATVFYALDDDERTAGAWGNGGGEGDWVVDVAVGLLMDPRGTVAAEDWLAWRTGRLAGMESGLDYDKGFAEGLAEGLKNWGLKTHGEITTFHIPQD